jgi:phosphomannomutase
LNDRIKQWIQRDPDTTTRMELEKLLETGDERELADRFDSRLAFGTAGLRGVVGAGPARMNRLVVRETSAGLGRYLLQEVANAAERGVVIAYDARPDSEPFARDAACVLAALGIVVYLTPDVTATPVAAYGVVELQAAAGVVVTASHNPPEYNGYKVYWENGAQIIPPHDSGIAAAIEIAATNTIPWLDFEQACAAGAIRILDTGFYRSYMDAIQSSPLFDDPHRKSISIAYTALHGVGAQMAGAMLREGGFSSFFSVTSQHEPDGSFPTVNFPNPEEPGAMDAVLALAAEKQATLACANDPDADRLAVAVRTETGDYHMLSGDMVGVLLASHLLGKQHDFTPIVCTTIVSSGMLERLAAAAGADYYETLTGFKWLSNVALEHEDESHQFLFAYEEALGYAAGRQVRDKDGLSALLAIAQMADSLARGGMTLLDRLESLYRQHGLFLTGQRSLALQPGARPIGECLRDAPPTEIADSPVVQIDDLVAGVRWFASGRRETLELPRSDVLIYRLENRARVIVRPSGTEPKLKCYYQVEMQIGDEPFGDAMQRANTALGELMNSHQGAISSLQG